MSERVNLFGEQIELGVIGLHHQKSPAALNTSHSDF